jgi:hypothetical protein
VWAKKWTDDETGKTMREYHTDCHEKLQEFVLPQNKMHGAGNLSVRKEADKRPVIIIGHDECVCCQCMLSAFGWKGPNGDTVLLPKSEEEGIMVSSFFGREIGFCFELTEEQLAQINAARNGQEYKARLSAQHLFGTARNPSMTIDQFK